MTAEERRTERRLSYDLHTGGYRRHQRAQHRQRVLRDTTRRMTREARNWTADLEEATA